MSDVKATPAGHPKVGDKVLYKYKDEYQHGWQKDWEVTEIGIENEHKLPLNIKIKKGEKAVIVPPYDENRIRIYPPQSEIPAKVKEFLTSHPKLIVFRSICNSEVPRYSFFCSHCLNVIRAEIESVEISGFGFSEDTFFENKPSMDSCDTQLTCMCETYDEPEGTQRYT